MKAGQGTRAPAAGILRLPLPIRGDFLALLRAAEPDQSQSGGGAGAGCAAGNDQKQ